MPNTIFNRKNGPSEQDFDYTKILVYSRRSVLVLVS